MMELKETTLGVFDLLFHPVHYWLEHGASIQQHQWFSLNFSRHLNEVAQAL